MTSLKIDITNQTKSIEDIKFAKNVLMNMGIPVLNNLKLNDNSIDSMLLYSGNNYAWINSTRCLSTRNDSINLLKESKTIKQDYSYGSVLGSKSFNHSFNWKGTTIEFDNLIIENTSPPSSYLRTNFDFCGMIAIGNLKYSNIVAIDYDQPKNLTSNGTLYLNDVPNEIKNNITKCKNINMTNTKSYEIDIWRCKLGYILFGTDYDFYLAKRLEDDHIEFDTLSYFHIFPNKYKEYFKSTYFRPNDNCTLKTINDSIERFECYNYENIQNFQSLHLIIDGWSYRLGSKTLFDRIDILHNPNNATNTTYYSKFLFSNVTEWTIGSGFLRKFMLGYNRSEDKVIIYTNNNSDRYNFTEFTSEEDDNNFFNVFLAVISSILFVIIVGLWILFYIKKRRIIKNYRLLNNHINK